MKSLKKYIAEGFGTMMLVILGCGVAMIPNAGLVGTAIAFGAGLFVIIAVIGPISGAHVNPAVSLGMAMNKKITWIEFAFYVLAQFIGGILGALLLYGIYKAVGSDLLMNYAGAVNSSATVGIGGAIAVEVILTTIFVLVVLASTSKKGQGNLAPLFIGIGLLVVHLLGIGLTGTSVNPARSFGVAMMQAIDGNLAGLKDYWIFLIAPLAGGAIAGSISYLFIDKEEKPVVEETEIKE